MKLKKNCNDFYSALSLSELGANKQIINKLQLFLRAVESSIMGLKLNKK